MAIPMKPEKTSDTQIEGGFYRVYSTLDSGAREEFPSGARRDTQVGKPRYDLIPVGPLERLANLYSRGAEKYGESNYFAGIPFKRIWASLLRHAFAWAKGDKTEDHGAAVLWNMIALMYYEDEIAAGRLPKSLNDMPKFDISKKE